MEKGSKHKQETILLMSKNKKGKCLGEKNPMFGKKHLESTKQLQREKNSGKNSYWFGKHRTKNQKEKYKEWRKTQILPKKDTLIEIKIQNFLKQLNIEFFTHQYMHIEHGYQCDIFIPSKNLVIECFGDYWHSYPYGRGIDSIRCRELREKGFKVLVFWEKEIRVMQLNDFKNKLQ